MSGRRSFKTVELEDLKPFYELYEIGSYRFRERIFVRFPHDSVMKDREKLSQMSGPVITYTIQKEVSA